MRQVALISAFIISFSSCQSRADRLGDYYNENANLHQAIADSLMLLSKTTETRIVIKKYRYVDNSIVFSFYYHNNPEPIAFSFDSLDRRRNATNNTRLFGPSTDLIKDIRSADYYAIQGDSNYVFFAVGYRGGKDRCDGITVVKKDSTLPADIKKLSSNSYVGSESVH